MSFHNLRLLFISWNRVFIVLLFYQIVLQCFSFLSFQILIWTIYGRNKRTNKLGLGWAISAPNVSAEVNESQERKFRFLKTFGKHIFTLLTLILFNWERFILLILDEKLQLCLSRQLI